MLKQQTGKSDKFFSGLSTKFVVLLQALPHVVLRYTDRIQRVFVPKFYYDKKDRNFLKGLLYIGEKKETDEKYFYEGPILGRKLYEYRIDGDENETNIHPRDLDWPFPEKDYQSIGYTIHGFSFKFKNADNNLSALSNPEDDLINVESGIENAYNNITEELFAKKKTIEEEIAEYNAIPIKNFINESVFLYDKSNLIKKTFITAINKYINLYESFSYFSGKTIRSNLKLLSSSNFLKFLVEKNSQISNLKFQLVHISRSDVKTTDDKIHHFSITKLRKKRKRQMSEPIETIIIKAQQDFDVDGGLNPIQIKIKDDKITNLLKKYKNVVYKITPIGLLFPALVTNDTEQIFILGKNLSGVKKSILNDKVYNILAVIDLNKINNWAYIKEQSVWTNVAFKDHKEINISSHLCFPFITRSFRDLTSFSIFLQDDTNKKVEFKSNEQKASIFNFQVDIFLI